MQLSQSPNLQLRTPPRSGLPITENEARTYRVRTLVLSLFEKTRCSPAWSGIRKSELASDEKRVQRLFRVAHRAYRIATGRYSHSDLADRCPCPLSCQHPISYYVCRLIAGSPHCSICLYLCPPSQWTGRPSVAAPQIVLALISTHPATGSGPDGSYQDFRPTSEKKRAQNSSMQREQQIPK